MPTSHALLSPSAAHRWLNCPAAPRLEETVKDDGSDYAKEGTLAHAYCAWELKTFLGQSTKEELAEIEELKAFHSPEMGEHVATYKTIVLEKLMTAKKVTRDASLLVETRLEFCDYIPEAFGTADAIIISDGLMEIIDFKYGKGVRVDAYKNPQMMSYALGAYLEFSIEYDIKRVRMTIVQPRLDNLSEYELSIDALLAWAEFVLKPKAKEAFEGKGNQCPGDWCRFCRVKNSCKALAEQCSEAVSGNPDPRLITADKMARDILPMIPVFKSWLSGVEDFALEQALSGVRYEGFKLVEGRSVRRITDPATVCARLGDAGFPSDSYMKPAELRSMTDLERLVGKKAFASLCGDLITKPQGKPTLAPSSDKRPVFNAAEDDFKDINV